MNCICEQCGHNWWARGNDQDANLKPKRCPGCMTTAWDRPKKKAGRPRKLAPDQPGLGLDPLPQQSQPSPVHPPTLCSHNRPVGAGCWQCPSGLAQ